MIKVIMIIMMISNCDKTADKGEDDGDMIDKNL